VGFVAILLIGFLADIATKSYVFSAYFRPNQAPLQHFWIDGIFGIETTTNPGALFGMFAGYRIVFAGLSIVALTGILLWVLRFGAIRDRWLTICLAMIAGGILGNLHDRLGFGFRPGYPEAIRFNVRDWIYFRWKGVPWFDPWPNFNIADSLLVCGAILLIAHSLFATSSRAPASAPQNSESALAV
jgi:signal peptidase II